MSLTSLMRVSIVLPLLVASACGSPPASVKQSEPSEAEVVSTVEATLDKAVAASLTGDAEGVLGAAPRDDTFTFVTADRMLVGYDQALAAFRQTYAMLQGQTNQVIQKRTRVVSPDVVLVTLVSEGTYTDKAGYTSDPVGLGLTAVFVRQAGEWRVVHVHQSVAE